MFSAGDIIEVTCNHPTLGMFSFDPFAGEDSTYMPGGYTSDDDDAAISGQGQMIDKMNRNRPSFACTIAGSPGDGVLEALNSLSGNVQPGIWTFTNVNGTIYRVTGKPVGALSANGNDSKIPLKVAGSGLLQIV